MAPPTWPLVDVQQGDRCGILGQSGLGPASLGDQQSRLAQIGHQFPHCTGVGLNTIGNRLARPVSITVNNQVGEQVNGITEFVRISHNDFILASYPGRNKLFLAASGRVPRETRVIINGGWKMIFNDQTQE